MTEEKRDPRAAVSGGFSTDRRRLLQAGGAAGLSLAGLAGLGMNVLAGGSTSKRSLQLDQDASPAAAPPPELGVRDDGSSLWKVVVGGMDMENAIEYHGFFPGEITINAGDAIWFGFDMPMFHTVTFPLAGEMPPPILIPDPEVPPPADGTPAAGPPKLILNPIMVFGEGELTVDGSALVSTPGDVFADPTVPWIVTFPVAGEYTYFCTPHAGVMVGKVIVQEAGAAYPADQAALDTTAAEQMAALQAAGIAEIEKYSQPSSTTKDDGSTLWEVALGAGGATQTRVQSILPSPLEVTVGDSIKFINQSQGEPHTVSFIGEGEEPPADTLEETFADGSPKLVQNPLTFFPQGGNTWSGTGWLNSGFLGIPEIGLPMDFEVLFDTPGDYIVFCVLHGGPDGSRMATPLTVKAAG